MIFVSHPTGNQNVRQTLRTFLDAGLLDRFSTTVSWQQNSPINALLPQRLRVELDRRSYHAIPTAQVVTTPIRELMRLAVGRMGLGEPKALSVLRIAKSLDQVAAAAIRNRRPQAVYAYEGVALQTFRQAKRIGSFCIYELPSGYWHYERELLRDEAERKPEFANTIPKLKDTQEHLDQKDEELALADRIIVPSSHVQRSLSGAAVSAQNLQVVPYGANENPSPLRVPGRSKGQRLKILFVGGLTQRKGISYALDGVAQLGKLVDLTLVGRRVGVCKPIDRALETYRWFPTLPHHRVLEEMANHDVLLLPSLTEGFALVISEALSRGLPVITTRNSGAEDLIRDGIEGFLVPIRSSEAIVRNIECLHYDRGRLETMSFAAKDRAALFGWLRYRTLLLSTVREALQ